MPQLLKMETKCIYFCLLASLGNSVSLQKSKQTSKYSMLNGLSSFSLAIMHTCVQEAMPSSSCRELVLT